MRCRLVLSQDRWLNKLMGSHLCVEALRMLLCLNLPSGQKPVAEMFHNAVPALRSIRRINELDVEVDAGNLDFGQWQVTSGYLRRW